MAVQTTPDARAGGGARGSKGVDNLPIVMGKQQTTTAERERIARAETMMSRGHKASREETLASPL